jgi:hypothetical protein
MRLKAQRENTRAIHATGPCKGPDALRLSAPELS